MPGNSIKSNPLDPSQPRPQGLNQSMFPTITVPGGLNTGSTSTSGSYNQLGGFNPGLPGPYISPTKKLEDDYNQEQALKGLQGSTDIQTNAASRLGKEQSGYASDYAKAQADYATAFETQKENFATQQAQLEAKLAGEAATQKEQLGEQAFGSRASALRGLVSGFTSGSGGGVTSVQPDIAGETAEQNAAFARAKDIAGSTGRSAVNALQDTMGGRGITGSGLGAGGVGGVINQKAQQLGDVNRQQLIDAQQLARQRASQTYQGNITQRGQNLGVLQGLIGAIGSGINY